MSALTPRLGLYKPGGGSTGLITPDEVVDVDRFNTNSDNIDAYAVATDARVDIVEGKVAQLDRLPYAESLGRVATSATADVTVTFPVGRFSQPPIVSLGQHNHPNVCVGYISAVTATNFKLSLFTLGGARVAATQVAWQATQMLPGNAVG